MNCTRCDAPLETNARFCRNCGFPVAAPASSGGAARPSPLSQPTSMNNAPTIPPTRLELPQPPQSQQPWAQPQSNPPQSQQPWAQSQQQSIPPTQAIPQSQYQYHQPAMPAPGGTGFASDGAEKLSPPPRPRSHRLRGCLLAGLSGLVVLVLLAAVAWPLLVRPFLNGLVKDQLNGVLSDAVNKIPIALVTAPAGPYKVTEDTLNNLIVLNSSSSDPVKNMQIRVTAQQMRMEFEVYGSTSAVSAVPKAENGKLVVTNVTIEGIAAQIISPDDVKVILDKHLADARARIAHPINGATLKDRELDLVLGPADNQPPGGPGGLPGGLPTPPP